MKKILIILCCISAVGFAQKNTTPKQKKFVPGFLGKRFSLAATFGGFPAFNQSLRYDDPVGSAIGLTWKAGLSGSYAITENSSVGFFFNFTNTACSYYSPTISIDSNYFGNASFNIFQAGATYKWFMGNNVAPVGPYIQVKGGIAVFNGNIMTTSKQVYFSNNYVDLAFYAAIGRQHVIKRVLLLDYGIELGGTGLIHLIDDRTGNPVEVSDDKGNTYNFQYGQKAAVINSVNLYVGLGVIF
jgi:hypothetical protein